MSTTNDPLPDVEWHACCYHVSERVNGIGNEITESVVPLGNVGIVDAQNSSSFHDCLKSPFVETQIVVGVVASRSWIPTVYVSTRKLGEKSLTLD
jgi:hypothetical protein